MFGRRMAPLDAARFAARSVDKTPIRQILRSSASSARLMKCVFLRYGYIKKNIYRRGHTDTYGVRVYGDRAEPSSVQFI